jgi:hypothetical protein
LASNDPKQRDLRHLATLVKLLAVRAPHLLAPGLNADDAHIEAFDSVPRAMRLCFRFGVPVVLMEAVFRQGHEAAKTFRFVEECAFLFPAHIKVGADVRTWCSWLAFLLEQPWLTAEQVARLIVALQEDGFPVPVFEANEGCEGNTFVVLFLSFNAVFEQPLTNTLVENMPPEVAASINPAAACAPEPVPDIWAIVPAPLVAPMEQEPINGHDDDDDGAPLPLPPPPSTPPQSPFAGVNQFPSHPPPHEDDDTLALSGAEDDDEEHKASSRELASPPPFDELDEEQQSNEQSASNLLAHDAAAVGHGHFASAAAAAVSIGAPQSMTDIPVSVSSVLFTASSSSPSSSSSAPRSARKRSSLPSSSSSSSNDEGDEPPAIRRKLLLSSPSPSSSLASLLFSAGPAVKSGLALAQDEGAAAAVGATAGASWDAIFFASTECSSHLLCPPHTPAASPPSLPELPSLDDFDPSSLFAVVECGRSHPLCCCCPSCLGSISLLTEA